MDFRLFRGVIGVVGLTVLCPLGTGVTPIRLKSISKAPVSVSNSNGLTPSLFEVTEVCEYR